MKKATLEKKVREVKDEYASTLQALYDALTKDQKKKFKKDKKIEKVFGRHNIKHDN